MDEETKERVSTLEVVLGEFIVQTNKALKRMEEDTKILKKEMNKRWGTWPIAWEPWLKT